MKVSSGTSTRPVISRLAFARRLAASVMTLRVMPDARKTKAGPERSGPASDRDFGVGSTGRIPTYLYRSTAGIWVHRPYGPGGLNQLRPSSEPEPGRGPEPCSEPQEPQGPDRSQPERSTPERKLPERSYADGSYEHDARGGTAARKPGRRGPERKQPERRAPGRKQPERKP